MRCGYFAITPLELKPLAVHLQAVCPAGVAAPERVNGLTLVAGRHLTSVGDWGGGCRAVSVRCRLMRAAAAGLTPRTLSGGQVRLEPLTLAHTVGLAAAGTEDRS